MMADIQDMYGALDEESMVSSQGTSRSPVSLGTITEFEVNGTRIRSIDPGYVMQLMRRIERNEQMIAELRNELRQMGNSLRQRKAESLNLQRQLDGKIDRQ